ncbi:MAG: hypothetical protein QM758_23785 [Armatimonas sp.]
MTTEIFRISAPLRWLVSIIFGGIVAMTTYGVLTGGTDSNGHTWPWEQRLLLWVGIAFVFLTPVIWIWRERITVSNTGLRWRRLGREQQASWDDVEDFYFYVTTQHARISTVRLRDGRTLQFDSSYSDGHRLRRLIAERATMAQAKGWLVRGKAGVPVGKVVFRYTEKRRRVGYWIQMGPALLFLSMGLALPLIPNKDGSHASWPLALVGIVPALAFGIMGGRAIREMVRRKDESYEASESGFVFSEGKGSSHFVPWNEVRALRRISGALTQWRMETNDDTYVFLDSLENASTLLGLVRHHGAFIELNTNEPQSKRDALVPTEKTEGKRVFHYRTRTNRHLLGVSLIMAALPLGAIGCLIYLQSSFSGELDRLPIPHMLVLTGLLLAGWAWGFRCYKCTQIVLDAETLTQVGLRGSKRVALSDIRRLGYSTGFFIETADGRRPICWNSSLADEPELRSILEQKTGLRFVSTELVEKVHNPAEETDDVEQQLERRHARR